MPNRNDKVARLHNETFDRLESFRTHPRDTVDDMVNHLLDKLDKMNRHRDDKGKFIKQPKETQND